MTLTGVAQRGSSDVTHPSLSPASTRCSSWARCVTCDTLQTSRSEMSEKSEVGNTHQLRAGDTPHGLLAPPPHTHTTSHFTSLTPRP
jgi:hypothetical protein